jgi:hypothetical protein
MAIAVSTHTQPSDTKAGRVRHAAPKDDPLKDERNRFLAFAFAAADLLIKVNAAPICAPSMSTASRSTARMCGGCRTATAICRS